MSNNNLDRLSNILSQLNECICIQNNINDIINENTNYSFNENILLLLQEQDIIQNNLNKLQKNILESIKNDINNTKNNNSNEENIKNDILEEEWLTEVKSEWKSKTGGCMNNSTWRNNPQILLKSQESGEITIHLTQILDNEEDRQGIGFYVFNGKNNEELITTNGSLVSRSSFSKNDKVSVTFDLPYSENGYIILPCTFHPNVQLRFSLSIESGSTGAMIRMLSKDDEFSKTIVNDEWKDKTAGGCKNHTSWIYNPQYYVKIDKKMNIHLLLTQDLHDFDAIGLYVFKAPDNTSISKVTPEELLIKSSFSSNKESVLSLEVDKDIIIIPCTFHPEKESKFTLQLYGPRNKEIPIQTLYDSKEILEYGEWNKTNAGGCTSFSTWRNNPQYVITSKLRYDISIRLIQEKKDENAFYPIGLFVFKDTGKRRLLVRPDDVLTSTKCSTLETINLSITKDLWKENSNGDYSFVIMPCTFYPNQYTKYTLSISTSNDIELPHIDIYKPFYQHNIKGEWNKENSGGCRNHFTWRENTQYQFIAQKDAKIMCVLQLPHEKSDTKHSIGFYITKAEDNKKVFTLNEDNIVKKAPFRKSFEAYCPISIEKGTIYNVIPCTFHPNIESKYTFSIFSNQEDVVSLKYIDNYTKIISKGEWKGDRAGGCLNNNSWWLNPRFALCISEEIEATIILLQKVETNNELEVKPKGLYLCNSDDNLEPLLSSPEDLVLSTQFEQSIDVLTTTILQANSKPYILIPSTFYPSEEAKFEIYIYIKEQLTSGIQLYPIVDIPLNEEEEEKENEEIIIEEDSNTNISDNIKEIPEESKIEEPIIEEVKKEEPIEESNNNTNEEAKQEDTKEPIDTIENIEPIKDEKEEISTNTNTPSIPPPPPKLQVKSTPIKKEITKVEKQVKPTETLDVFQQIKEGKFLRKVKESEKIDYRKRTQEEFFKGFNMQKIIARRKAIEYSDDEEEDYSDHEDDDWW